MSVLFKKPGTTANAGLGTVASIIGKGGSYGLTSERNLLDTSVRVSIKATNKAGDEARLICSSDLSGRLRNAENAKQFEAILDEIAAMSVYEDKVQETDRRGKKLFNDEGEPLMTTIWYIGNGQGADMSAYTKTVANDKIAAPARSVFKFEERIAGI